MALKRATNSIQSQLLLEMGVPADTADMYRGPEYNRLTAIPSSMKGSQFGSFVSWTVDALIDYLCDGDNVYVEFQRSPFGNGSFWVCYYKRYEDKNVFGVSKAGPTKIDAIFEVIYELHRNKYDTGTEKEN